jgi:hypothetical protein
MPEPMDLPKLAVSPPSPAARRQNIENNPMQSSRQPPAFDKAI